MSSEGSPLMKLPPEIRNMIYRYLVSGEIQRSTYCPNSGGIQGAAILCANKEIGAEAGEVIYNESQVVLKFAPATLSMLLRRGKGLNRFPLWGSRTDVLGLIYPNNLRLYRNVVLQTELGVLIHDVQDGQIDLRRTTWNIVLKKSIRPLFLEMGQVNRGWRIQFRHISVSHEVFAIRLESIEAALTRPVLLVPP
jgi:hypothetical protein